MTSTMNDEVTAVTSKRPFTPEEDALYITLYNTLPPAVSIYDARWNSFSREYNWRRKEYGFPYRSQWTLAIKEAQINPDHAVDLAKKWSEGQYTLVSAMHLLNAFPVGGFTRIRSCWIEFTLSAKDAALTVVEGKLMKTKEGPLCGKDLLCYQLKVVRSKWVQLLSQHIHKRDLFKRTTIDLILANFPGVMIALIKGDLCFWLQSLQWAVDIVRTHDVETLRQRCLHLHLNQQFTRADFLERFDIASFPSLDSEPDVKIVGYELNSPKEYLLYQPRCTQSTLRSIKPPNMNFELAPVSPGPAQVVRVSTAPAYAAPILNNPALSSSSKSTPRASTRISANRFEPYPSLSVARTAKKPKAPAVSVNNVPRNLAVPDPCGSTSIASASLAVEEFFLRSSIRRPRASLGFHASSPSNLSPPTSAANTPLPQTPPQEQQLSASHNAAPVEESLPPIPHLHILSSIQTHLSEIILRLPDITQLQSDVQSLREQQQQTLQAIENVQQNLNKVRVHDEKRFDSLQEAVNALK
ncbi:hypothetical protein HDV05_003193 [Chytridiales sp. JEL 0842]|nr:hypothetical protein HDV05_003193 [Chytridiales sp. JEL 0842]